MEERDNLFKKKKKNKYKDVFLTIAIEMALPVWDHCLDKSRD